MNMIQEAHDAIGERRIHGANLEGDMLGVIGYLPAQVQAKIGRLCVERDSAWAGMRHRQDQANDAFQAWKDAEIYARHQEHFVVATGEDGRPSYKDRKDEDAACSLRLLAAYDAWKRSGVNLPALSAKWESYSFLSDVKSWITRDGENNRRYKKHSPAHIKGTDHAGAVARTRTEIAAIESKIEAIEFAPATAAELIERASAEVERIAAYGSMRVNSTDRSAPAVDLDWNPGLQSGGNFSAHRLLWIFKDEVKEKLAGIIRAEVPTTGALTDAERTIQRDRLAGEKLALERTEEALICAADDAGQYIARRRDADPRAILEVA